MICLRSPTKAMNKQIFRFEKMLKLHKYVDNIKNKINVQSEYRKNSYY